MKRQPKIEDLLAPLLKNAKLPKKRKPEKCPECKGSLTIMKTKKGLGYCETCCQVTAVPVGIIVNKGSHKGKLVYLASSVLAEEAQDADMRDAKEELKEELRTRDYFLVKLFEEDER